MHGNDTLRQSPIFFIVIEILYMCLCLAAEQQLERSKEFNKKFTGFKGIEIN